MTLNTFRKEHSASRRLFSVSSTVIPGIVVGLDSVAILLSGVLTYGYLMDTVGLDNVSYYAAAVAFVWLVAITVLKFGGLYQLDAIIKPFSFIDKLFLAFAITFLFLMAAAFSIKVSAEYSRVWTASFASSSCATAILLRIFISQVVGRLADNRMLSRNVVLVGSGEQIKRLVEHLEISRPRFVSVLGVFSDDGNNVTGAHRFLGQTKTLASFVRDNDVDDVIISFPWAEDEKIAKLTNEVRELPVNIYLGADLIGFRMPLRAPPDHFGELPLVEVMGRPLAGWGVFQKAVLDYSLGILLTFAFLPMMALVALVIRLESEGPALFRQERYGFANRRFHIYKFRTMFQTAVSNEITIQATRYDPRVTRIGGMLRRFSLDELPQLFNVLNGTMSLVGPRPHAVDHNEAYSQVIRGYFARHRVKPGLTGWAQVNGFRGETNTEQMEARVKYDTYYVENWSLLFDLKILAMTGVVCLSGRNAY